VPSWAEPLRSAALRGRRGRLGFSSKLQTAWLRLRWRTGCCQLRPERRLRAARPRRGGLGCCTSPAGGGGWRTQGGGPLTAGHAPPWSSPTGAPPARISSRTLCRDAQARALAPARSRARALSRPRARACACLHHLEIEYHPFCQVHRQIYHTRCRADAFNSAQTQT
jgi:hypothetical protein